MPDADAAMMLVMGSGRSFALCSSVGGHPLENLALRHQLVVLKRSVRRPRLARWDRVFWVWLARVWAGWRPSLVIVPPATVLAWHRQGFRLYWRRQSGRPVGRPKLDAEIRHLIRRMARDNPTWGRRSIQANSPSSATTVAELTVAEYMPNVATAFARPGARFWPTTSGSWSPSISSSSPPWPCGSSSSSSSSPRPARTRPHQRHRTPHGPLDGPAARGGVPGRYGADVPAPRSRCGLRGRVPATRQGMGIHESLTAPRSPWQNDYASHCTSLRPWGTRSLERIRLESFTPWAFFGAWVGGGS